MDLKTVQKYWDLFRSALDELEEEDKEAAEQIMNAVSSFETDWWGGRG